jgi:hypothetical protein
MLLTMRSGTLAHPDAPRLEVTRTYPERWRAGADIKVIIRDLDMKQHILVLPEHATVQELYQKVGAATCPGEQPCSNAGWAWDSLTCGAWRRAGA